jgi:hypothetical protein
MSAQSLLPQAKAAHVGERQSQAPRHGICFNDTCVRPICQRPRHICQSCASTAGGEDDVKSCATVRDRPEKRWGWSSRLARGISNIERERLLVEGSASLSLR